MHALETIKILNAAHAEEAKQARQAVEAAAAALQAEPTSANFQAYEKAVANAGRF